MLCITIADHSVLPLGVGVRQFVLYDDKQIGSSISSSRVVVINPN